jgi:hypothetical protein
MILALAAAAAAPLGCASDDDAAIPEPQSAAKGRVTSSIPEGAQLSGPLHWTARVTGVPQGRVAAVRFLIDGEVARVDRAAPYEFASRAHTPGTALGRGSHTLAVDARLTGGRRLTAASTATINERKAR